MRIVMANTLYPTPMYPKIIGGAERSVRNLTEALLARGHEITAIRAVPRGATHSQEFVDGVVVHSIPIRNIYWPFEVINASSVKKLVWHIVDDWSGYSPEFAHILAEFRPDILHTNNMTAMPIGIWSQARASGAKIVHTLRDYSLLCPNTKLYKNGRTCDTLCTQCRLTTSARRKATSRINAVVGNSLATLELHKKHGLFRDTPVATAIGSLPAVNAVKLQPRIRRFPGETVFGYIGRVAEDKGVHLLAKAFRSIADPRASLKIAGYSTPEEQSVLNSLAGNKRIEYLGFVDPRTFYEAVDVVVVPSLWPEPLPRAVIDAISFGRPVIASNRGGNPESMGTPPYGLIFDPENIADLIDCLTVALSGIAIPDQQNEQGSPVELYEEVYARVL